MTKIKTKTETRKASAKAIAPRVPAGSPGRNRRSAETRLQELKQRLREIGDLGAAGALLDWDQATYMPEGGATARARQGADADALIFRAGQAGYNLRPILSWLKSEAKA